MELLSFRKFNDKETAEALGQLFNDNKILFEIISDAGNLDELYGNSELHNYSTTENLFSAKDES
jgi:hypothetical protein